ncbi:phage tail protein [Paenibacillus sp. GCM10027627]|uniref:phage tail protein n=1 Tax=unclassified Paenibacillus TaxID=185978 RepID=UPI0036317210
MSEPFVGQIQAFPYNRIPRGWFPCNGQLLPIQTYQVLFSLLGTAYGGDGIRTFGLPNLNGRVPVGVGSVTTLGEKGGEDAHTLTVAEMPQHTHTVNASKETATINKPAGTVWAQSPQPCYATGVDVTLKSTALGNTGGSQPHNNMQPYLALSFCIANNGIYPSRG